MQTREKGTIKEIDEDGEKNPYEALLIWNIKEEVTCK